MLRVGLVGAGAQATDSLIPAILGVPDAQLSAICDIDKRKASEVASHNGVRHVFGTLDAMLASVEIDAVVAACPPQAHEAIVYSAVEHRVPVFVEKPPATTTQIVGDLARELAEAGLTSGVGMNFRYATAYGHLRDLLRSGRFGQPVSLVLRHLANKPREPMWGLPLLRSVLLAQVIHPIDLVIDLLGAPDDCEAVVRRHADRYTIAAQLTGHDGWVASVVSGTATQRFHFALDVVTDQGAIVSCSDLWDVSVEGVAWEEGQGDGSRLPWTRRWSAGALERGYSRAGYQGEIRAFLGAVRAAEPHTPELADLLPAYTILDAIEASDP